MNNMKKKMYSFLYFYQKMYYCGEEAEYVNCKLITNKKINTFIKYWCLKILILHRLV